MSRFMLFQAIYCVTGILFFVQDLFARVPMMVAMLHAFIWPYAQWGVVIKGYALIGLAKVLSMIPH